MCAYKLALKFFCPSRAMNSSVDAQSMINWTPCQSAKSTLPATIDHIGHKALSTARLCHTGSLATVDNDTQVVRIS